MRVTRKLDVPNIRGLIEREMVASSIALSRFESGQGETDDAHCCVIPLENGIVNCVTVVSGSDVPVETILRSTDLGNWAGTVTTGACWGGVAHHAIGAGGHVAPSTAIPVTAGEILFARANFREETGDDAWENNTNYDYDFDWKFTDTTDPFHILHISMFDVLYHNMGCIDEDQYVTIPVPAGFNRVQVRVNSKLGGIRYRIELGTVDIGEVTITTTCSVVYQTVIDQEVPEDATELNQSIIAQLTRSGSNFWVMPYNATDVSDVWIDNLPTDVWDFQPDNVIELPETLSEDSQVYARFFYGA